MNQPNPQPGSSRQRPTMRSVRVNASNPIVQLLSLLMILALIVIGFAVAIPVIILLAVLFLLLNVYIRIRLWLNRTRAPNGPLDGRHNVRVIKRDE